MLQRLPWTSALPPADFRDTTVPSDRQTGWKRRTQRKQSGHAQHSTGKASWRERTTIIPGGYNIYPSRLQLIYYINWSASKLMIADQSSPISSLVLALQSAQGSDTGPRRIRLTGTNATPMLTSPHGNSKTGPGFPTLGVLCRLKSHDVKR